MPSVGATRYVGLAIGLCTGLWAGVSMAQDGNSGPRFLRAGERDSDFETAHRFQPAFQSQRACTELFYNISFCGEGAAWVPEQELAFDHPGLFRDDAGHQAAISAVFMPEDASQALDATALDNLIRQHVYVASPRGPRQLLRVLNRIDRPDGRPYEHSAIILDQNGDRQLLMVKTVLLDYGVGFLEITLPLPQGADPERPDDAAQDIYLGFLNTSRISYNVGTGR